MSDVLYAGRMAGVGVGFSYAVTTGLVNEAVVRHNCDPVSAHILGRALTAGVLATAPAPTHERVNLCWQYRGHLRTVLVDAGADGAVRGLISPTNLSDFRGDKQDLYGEEGRLQVIRSAEGLVINSGTVPCMLQDVVEDLAWFLSTSDQVETGAAVLIGFRPDPDRPVRVCRGLLLQAMPEADLAIFERFRRALGREAVRALLGRETEPDGHVESILHCIAGSPLDSLGLLYDERAEPRFRCTCDRDKMAAVLRAIPDGERLDILAQGEPVRIHCRYCNKRYVLPLDECRILWAHGGTSPS
jgi:molecular chaperone Hsp33